MSNDALADLNGTLDRISATLDNRCGQCGEQIPQRSVSAYFCDDECQWRWQQAQATAPRQVECRPDAAPYPGGPMFWEPGLVDIDPGPDLVRAGAVPAAMDYTGEAFAATIYRRMSRAAWHLRLDDGHRFVGRDLPDAQLGDEESMRAAAARTWDALEAELTNEARARPAATIWEVRDAALSAVVFGGWGAWVDVGWTTDTAMVELAPPPADRMWALPDGWGPESVTRPGARIGDDSRPVRRWCLYCDECHPTARDAPHQCGRCHAVLPRLRHAILSGGVTARLTVSGPDGIFCQGLLTQPCDAAATARLFERLEGQVVRQMRAERERARYNTVRLNPNLHAQVRGATWRVPVSRHASEPLMPPALADWVAGWTTEARSAIVRTAETVSRMQEHRTRAAAGDRGQERPAFADAVRRRRERQGHTGPQGQARAPRRIDPRGGAR